MIETKPRSKSSVDADGVRVVREGGGWPTTLAIAAAGLVVALTIVFVGHEPRPSSEPPIGEPEGAPALAASRREPVDTEPARREAELAGARVTSLARMPSAPGVELTARKVVPHRRATGQKSYEPDPEKPALRTYEGKKEIDAADYIAALRESGETEGIAAFNPPGTDPPKTGLVVPEDFELPEGYVRHYQATDDGQGLEPILMFSEDFDFFDDAGNPIAIPDNRVVPPDLVPPGFPIRELHIPEPRRHR